MVKRSRRCPLKAKSWVRFPLEVPLSRTFRSVFLFFKKDCPDVFNINPNDFLHPFTDRRRQTACAVICYRFHFSVNCPTNFLTVFPRFFIENAQIPVIKSILIMLLKSSDQLNILDSFLRKCYTCNKRRLT